MKQKLVTPTSRNTHGHYNKICSGSSNLQCVCISAKHSVKKLFSPTQVSLGRPHQKFGHSSLCCLLSLMRSLSYLLRSNSHSDCEVADPQRRAGGWRRAGAGALGASQVVGPCGWNPPTGGCYRPSAASEVSGEGGERRWPRRQVVRPLRRHALILAIDSLHHASIHAIRLRFMCYASDFGHHFLIQDAACSSFGFTDSENFHSLRSS
jgi:hypothetical protein